MKNKFWNTFGDQLGNTIIHPQFIMHRFTKSAIDQAKKSGKGDLLDIGCGRMEYKTELLKKVQSYTGVDHPKVSHLYQPNQRPDFLADASDLPFKNNSYDTVLLLQVLEYLEKPNESIKEIVRVLKPDGLLILSSPFLYPIHDAPYDRARYTKTALKELLESHGLKIQKIEEQGTFTDFFIQNLLVFLFKRTKEMIKSRNLFTRVLFVLMLIISLLLTIPLNLLYLLLKKLAMIFPKFENNYPLNYTVVAKK